MKYQFPLRVACIDMGSNAIRFVIADFSDANTYQIIYHDRAPIRLGHSVFLTGKLDQALMDKTIELLKTYQQKLVDIPVVAFRCVATSAVRESTDRQAFIDRIKEQTGINLEIISGTEEARLVYLAIRSKIQLGNQNWILIDLGGGSVELSLINKAGVVWSESHTMGSVRLLEELASSENRNGKLQNLLTEYISLLKIPFPGTFKEIGGLIATGGNIEDLAKIASLLPNDDGVSSLPLQKLSLTIETLFRLSYTERVEELHLREDRADVILPASMVYEHIARLAGVDHIMVPNVGTKEGVLLDLIQAITKPESHFEEEEKFIEESCINIGLHYMFDEDHARQVTKLSKLLFDQLISLHKLPVENRKLLIAASLLHDIGSFISYSKHHKHSQYLIENSEIAGLTETEVTIVANIARYHRKSDPSLEHSSYKDLPEEYQKKVMILSSILRLSDPLDREHQRKVDTVMVKHKEKSLLIVLSGKGDLSLECWSFKRKSKLFSDLFNVNIEITEQFGS